ncbi:lipoprotein [Mycoplasma mycoides]|uniref:lipoprotein n=1 Tax=Mycoplasma mycoides TaxID=2102 RepID=UPI00223F14B6|nr:lipoprotein [Mycoplasma mycoides]QVK06350.1 lipoprotein [Mycoplasma mycoides subsp. capri]QVK08876.1 lipoprotein [Mycoplasma mycoides subsp. capri]QVK08981.1 lipoprotein [Mycoplasma mycoides subsp. capri]
MKKIIPILSFITALSSSLIVVSCKTDNNNQKIKEKENETGSNKKEIETPNNNSNPSERDLLKDQPINKEQKDEKTNNFADKFKKDIKDLLDKKDDSKIKDYAKDLITKYLQKSSEKQLLNNWFDLEKKIKKWFDESKLDYIKKEITILFSESFNTSSNNQESRKIKDLLDKVTKENKSGILEEVRNLFGKKVSKELEEELKVKIDEVNNLLSKMQYDTIKSKLFDIVDKTAELEKSVIK